MRGWNLCLGSGNSLFIDQVQGTLRNHHKSTPVTVIKKFKIDSPWFPITVTSSQANQSNRRTVKQFRWPRAVAFMSGNSKLAPKLFWGLTLAIPDFSGTSTALFGISFREIEMSIWKEKNRGSRLQSRPCLM